MLPELLEPAVSLHPKAGLPWIHTSPSCPYFVDALGAPWTPIGQNDALPWPDLRGLLADRDLASVEAYLDTLARSGVSCLRMMLEYCESAETYFERPAGVFNPMMVAAWDRLFEMCEQRNLRVLLTPFDTYWMWLRWDDHPYNARNGGPSEDRAYLLQCPRTRDAVKHRLRFASDRWGGSGVLFAWDVWNEIHLAYGNDDGDSVAGFAQDVSSSLRDFEAQRFGQAHPQTISAFWPHLLEQRVIRDLVLSHPAWDFASIHLYEEGTIDKPENTVDAALASARLLHEALLYTPSSRPLLDSEHGPIHTFKDLELTLPEDFDDEYFRHIQWAHLASGAAGGGMRWPNRDPHSLTRGMRRAQHAMSRFLELIDWTRFRRRNCGGEARSSNPAVAPVCCSDATQAIAWLVRRDSIGEEGRLRRDVPEIETTIEIPGLDRGEYLATFWDTPRGTPARTARITHEGGERLRFSACVRTDLAVAVRRTG